MELSPRLRAAAELVPHGAHFADIGTDHAYLPTWLLLNGVIDHAIAADLRPGPLDRARETAEKYAVSDCVDFRLCDGLNGLQPGEADAIAIAGMGGETIIHILSQAPWTKEEGMTLILQPMSTQPELRRWLAGNGYVIESERTVREDKTLYTLMLVKAGTMELTDAEACVGRQGSDPLRGEYLEHIIAKTSRALEGRKAAAQRDEEAIRQMSELLTELKKMKEEWEAWQQ